MQRNLLTSPELQSKGPIPWTEQPGHGKQKNQPFCRFTHVRARKVKDFLEAKWLEKIPQLLREKLSESKVEADLSVAWLHRQSHFPSCP